MERKQSKNESRTGRTAQFYNSILNKKLRELLHESNKAAFAAEMGVSVEAVRQWTGGYSRPDIEKIPLIAEYFNVSCDYILRGVETINLDSFKDFGFSGMAFDNLRYVNETKHDYPESAHNVHKTLNFLIENMGEVNIFGIIAKYFDCDYEMILTDDLKKLASESMISIEAGGLRDNILVREKNTGTISSFPATYLPEMFMLQIQHDLKMLRKEYKLKEAANNGDSQNPDA